MTPGAFLPPPLENPLVFTLTLFYVSKSMLRELCMSNVLRRSVFLVLPIFLFACTPQENAGPGASTFGKQSEKKVLRLSLSDSIKTLDPSNAYDSISLTILPLVLESLYQYSYLERPVRLEPLLAVAMPTLSPDKKKYTIKIKKGVYYQDDKAFPNSKGRELEAKDFVYQWKRLLHPQLHSNGSWIFEDKVVGYNELKKNLAKAKGPEEIEKLLMEPMEGFKVLDKYTIEINLLRPYPQLVYVLAMGFCVPAAKEVIDTYGHLNLNQRMVGTGPFILKEFVQGSRIILEKSPSFRGEKYPTKAGGEARDLGLLEPAGKPLPFLDQIDFRIIKEDSPRWLLLNQGNLDIGGIPKDNFDIAITANKELSPELEAKGMQVRIFNRPVIFYLNFNMKDQLLGNNVNLRKALMHAIDRDYFINTFLNGRASKKLGVVPPGIHGYIPRDKPEGDYDLEKAKEYLEKAGYPGGKGLPTINYDLRGANTTSRQRGEYFKRALSKIGVNLKVISNTFPAYLEKERTGNLQFFMGGWGADYPDAENFLQLLYSANVSPGPNASNWKNKEFDDLYIKISLMSPSKKRLELIKRAEEIIFKEEAVWSMLFNPKSYNIYHAWVKNYYPNDLLQNSTKYLDVDVKKRKFLKSKF